MVPSMGSTIHSTSAFGSPGLWESPSSPMQDLVNQILAFDIGGELDVVRHHFVDV
jgi:hypothetical protein